MVVRERLLLAAQVDAVARQQENEYAKNCPDHSGILPCHDDGGHKAPHPQPQAGLTVLKKPYSEACHAQIGEDVRHTFQAMLVFHAVSTVAPAAKGGGIAKLFTGAAVLSMALFLSAQGRV